ncbi:GPI inositol-deacylase [Taphrina deformans PYCC 5710]|uniref:GPI inositol-deacylase n=1 Tax=Taphrina deformans (strain PYCC 5710 / ATCC 11124 / CBS 356.35 / IMI 108563 / JCM 9778 / NBRC 8474) TaxID=1097556 RepID=R4X894_TAPDE|nr:GPI inositol-deacylase [Taphrina deformans PYCC 5710]|eukprot:CCG81487.1 GPI inositol-deacylase [Taphrina deformans PYCC 5710]
MEQEAAVHGGKLLYKVDKDTRSRQRQSTKPCRLSGRALYLITIFSIAFVLLVRHSFNAKQRDSKVCNMSFMYPSYRHLHGFDHEHTRFASKYSLYLYREMTIDLSEEPQGVPVLFVPGNAGSYKQIRPIAAEAAAQFQQSLKDNPDILRQGKRSLDFFTVDFNEDFSAFHGQTMLDQAEYLNSAITYILSLYTDARKSPSFRSLPDPTSVIIIGHSMGGLVARLTQIMPNYLPKSINTILTMSTPHAIPPAPFDPRIQQIYEDVNQFWHRSFSKPPESNPLKDVSLVSIAGGGLDTIVASDYSSVRMFAPVSNAFTVFTSTIPDVWISADHQAILWCDQFRKVVARALLECVDARMATQTSGLAHRMDTFSRHFLSQLDKKSGQRRQLSSFMSAQYVDEHIDRHAYSNGTFLRQSFSLLSEDIDVLSVAPNTNASVQFLTNINPRGDSDHSTISIHRCLKQVGTGMEVDKQLPALVCDDLTGELAVLPSRDDLSHTGSNERTYFLEHKTCAIPFQHYFVVKSRSAHDNRFVAAQVTKSSSDTEIDVTIDMFSLFFGGFRIIFGSTQSLMSTIRVRGLVSSLITYKLRIATRLCKSRLMETVTRQHMATTFESKYHVESDVIDINLHGQAPFFPPVVSADQGLVIQHWSDPACSGPLDVALVVDYLGSLGKLVMRFRVVLIVYPLAMALLVVWLQTVVYNSTGSLLSFQQGLRMLVAHGLAAMLLVISAVSLCLTYVQQGSMMSLGRHFMPSDNSQASAKYVMLMNDKLLGLQDPFLWWLAPLFLLVSIGMLNTASLFLDFVIKTVAVALDAVKGNSSIATEQAERSFSRRLITTAILLGFVSFLVPYQFAYIVACIVQLATCVRLLRSTDTRMTLKAFNFNFGILTLMICVLPINIPILVVWVRNISVQWLTPFSSHHNVLSVAPIMLLVESLTNGWIAPPIRSPFEKLLGLIILVMSCIILLYGVMYTYLLHHILNVLAGCLFLYQHFSTYTLSRQVDTGKN